MCSFQFCVLFSVLFCSRGKGNKYSEKKKEMREKTDYEGEEPKRLEPRPAVRLTISVVWMMGVKLVGIEGTGEV